MQVVLINVAHKDRSAEEFMGKGFIREETDIKSLLLYSLSLLPFALDEALFFDYVHVDDGFDYFDFSQAEEELASAGLIAIVKNKSGKSVIITPSGSEVNSSTWRQVAASVRQKMERKAIKVIQNIKRERSLKASHTLNEKDGSYTVHLAITDRSVEIFSVELVLYSEAQCRIVENSFKENAKTLYASTLDVLCGLNNPGGNI